MNYAKGLFVEDDKAYRDQITRLFRIDGYSVDSATDGETALRLLREGRYGWGLFDLGLPGKAQGEDLLKAIADEGLETIPIVLTGEQSDARMLNNIRNGAVVYLKKPCTYEQIKAHVDTIRRLRENLDPVLECGDVVYNTRSQLLFVGNSEPVRIDGIHGKVLAFLMSTPNSYHAFDEVYEAGWGEDASLVRTGRVKSLISELRTKLLEAELYNFIDTNANGEYGVLSRRRR